MPDPDLGRAWRMAVAELRRRNPGAAFELWIDDVQPMALAAGRVHLGAPNPMVKDLLADHFADSLSGALGAALGRPVAVEFHLPGELPAPLELAAPARREPLPLGEAADDDGIAPIPLNPRFTFDNFVVGASNRFPHAAAKAVAKAPARSYNPLFFYGGVGLGKTHLMQAIAWRMREHYPEATVAYVSGETFLHHFVMSIREDRMADFRRRYRSVDLWLVDDIQFIASRESTRTEAEFFHTFNALHETNKQIVVTSDRPPKELLIDDRLRSRFEWGLITDIKPPDIETRLAILQKRVGEEHLEVPDDVLMYLAHVVRDSIRLLEGSLLKVVAAASLLDQEVTLELARDCLQDYSIGEKAPALNVRTVLEAVSRQFGQRTEEVRGKSRRAELVLPRQVAMYLCRDLIGLSFADIGGQFERDHSTVMHACSKVSEKLLAGDPTLIHAVDQIRDELDRPA